MTRKRFPRQDAHGHPRTPRAVNCIECGFVYLSELQYAYQMDRPDSTWRCPVCGGSAGWSDDNYESYREPL